MPRHSLAIAGGLAATLILAAHAAKAEDWKKPADPVMGEINTVAGAADPVLNSVMDTSDLTSGSAEVGLPYGEGFSAEEWELDETLGKPVFALADKALVAKGEPNLQGQGVDTGLINQGLSLQGGEVGVGTLNASPEAGAVMGTVTTLMSPQSYIP
jgi:hypothetical protein